MRPNAAVFAPKHQVVKDCFSVLFGLQIEIHGGGSRTDMGHVGSCLTVADSGVRCFHRFNIGQLPVICVQQEIRASEQLPIDGGTHRIWKLRVSIFSARGRGWYSWHQAPQGRNKGRSLAGTV
ncbi:hypothetical protein [Paenarthrobacter sp. TA1.8]|uniref:hypothetical protein n=1 Tax=Paenarthrobacter sp. TA1.8 TaxID=3400219 RepID=UPI003B432F86